MPCYIERYAMMKIAIKLICLCASCISTASTSTLAEISPQGIIIVIYVHIICLNTCRSGRLYHTLYRRRAGIISEWRYHQCGRRAHGQ